ncbi:ROK family protein [Rhodocyclus tenuis]|uniref:ROK family protein n=1 Tax=Rhodocyclus tenuis TaxID=1066 RepID=A0A6L5JYQ9_RHOTE|nr:ROK family protein [Rhodocyclus gracilis]
MRLGIDLGGTKIEVAAVDAAGRPVLRRRLPTPQGDYRATLDLVRQLVVEAEQSPCLPSGRPPLRVGVATPGAETDEGLLQNSNSVCLNGQPLRADLETMLQREIRLANDANCFALAEAISGAAQGAACVFGVILGTGVGGGIVVRGQVLDGANRIAGEWGHNPLADPSPLVPTRCYCGRQGCVESWLSGPALAADHFRHTGRHGSPEAIVAEALASSGEPATAAAQATLTRYIDRLGRALATVVNILDPQVIVLGGGLSNIPALPERTFAAMLPHVFSAKVRTRLIRHALGDSAGVLGAAALWAPGE